MAANGAPVGLQGDAGHITDVAVQRPWRIRARLSSFISELDGFLDRAGFDRGPWLAVGLVSGIGLWFWLKTPWQWLGALAVAGMLAIATLAIWRGRDDRAALTLAVVGFSAAAAMGLSLVWARSELIGAEPISSPRFERFDARILARENRPADDRVRLILAVRNAENGRAMRIRANLPMAQDDARLREGAVIRLRMRMMPPSPPILPGAYDFARMAWFQGYAATGSVVGPVEVVEASPAGRSPIAEMQRQLSAHVREQLGGAPGTIAAAFASGDRGAITRRDEEAMRDSGLTHLLSISGLHVSAVIGAAYLISMAVLALFPWLVLRVRLPLLAAGIAALVGIGYTLLTGAEVPTVRSCIGAVLVLLALALGREPLSMRMVAVAAIVVLILWPEALVGPSFQMSFSAVIAIVALHGAGPVRAFLAPREEGVIRRSGRRVLMLFITGLVIEIALTPIVLFHFHRAGLYGAFANVIAIPLVTFVSMPLIALALLLDILGLGAPVWWLAGQSLDLLLVIARWTAEQPGAVKLVPQIGLGTVLLFVTGGLWIALWRGRARLWGLLPVLLATVALAFTPKPDVLISRDGQHVGIVGQGDRLLVLRDSRSDYARDNLLELAGMEGNPIALERWPQAQCSADFCVADIERGKRRWSLLMARSRNRIEERALAAACERVDIVVADRYLPRSCKPRWLKADRRFLDRKGGLTLYLGKERIDAVVDHQGQHGWWKTKEERVMAGTHTPKAPSAAPQ